MEKNSSNLDKMISISLLFATIAVTSSELLPPVPTCDCMKLEDCILDSSRKCWKKSFGDVLPPAVLRCERDFFPTFRYVDDIMNNCTNALGYQHLCPALRGKYHGDELKSFEVDNIKEHIEENHPHLDVDHVVTHTSCWDDAEKNCIEKCGDLSHTEYAALDQCALKNGIAAKEAEFGKSFGECVQYGLISDALV